MSAFRGESDEFMPLLLDGNSAMFSPRSMNLPRLTYLAILSGTSIWCLAIALAPVCMTLPAPFPSGGEAVYSVFHPICHQIPERSLMVAGRPLAVCSRCSAIYFAFLAATLLYPLVRDVRRPIIPPRWILVLALLPMVLDAVPGMFGLHDITVTTRLLTGAMFGLVVPFFVIPAAIEGIVQLSAQSAQSTSHKQKGLTNA
jgi:uncharacterized membrane protein